VLSKLFESLYNKVIVSIVLNRKSCSVYIEICSKSTVVDSQTKTFETATINQEIIEFVSSYTKESPYSYYSVLDTSVDQGAIPACKKSELSYYKNLDSYEYKCFDEKWVCYTLKNDLYEMKQQYKDFGVDFIFSPISIIYNFFEDKVKSHFALYVLVQDNFVSLSVFENSALMFAQHLDMKTSSDEELSASVIEVNSDLEESIGIDLDDVDVIEEMEDMEDLDDFGDIEDLDSLEEIDEFSESQDIEEEFFEIDEPIVESDDDSVNEDYQRFTLIQKSLGDYYNDKHYSSNFIETIYIADGVGVSSDLKKYLEEEMFLNVYIRRLDIPMEICSLAKGELGL